jgi:murein DD-endopeptidase MepM/ murein hydrolase activator NlpD
MSLFRFLKINKQKNSVSRNILYVFSAFSLILGGYSLFSVLSSSNINTESLATENKLLKKELKTIMAKYSIMSNRIDSLANTNNDLRLAVNLHPVSDDELKVGVGGGYFDNSIDFLSSDADAELEKASSFVDEISRKIEFEKTQFLEISEKLKENKKLSLAIPAIKPCNGTLSDGFGLRMHPILHIRRMHEGLDFVADVGTPVYATGNAVVSYTGHKEGYGLVVELDHGFGYRTIYAHLSKILVKEGKKVKRGDLIAKTGDSGLSTGPHLHYEVEHDGVKENPEGFFFDDMGFFELTAQK